MINYVFYVAYRYLLLIRISPINYKFQFDYEMFGWKSLNVVITAPKNPIAILSL